MMKIRAFLKAGIRGACILLAVSPAVADPAWWSAPETFIRNPGEVARDYSPANLGQLKNVATQAKAFLDRILSRAGGAGAEVNTVCQFTNSGNYSPLNLGQLKNVAKPFYDRLAQIHYNWRTGTVGVADPLYPWTGTVGAENAMPANLGQLKYVFSFEPGSAFLSADEDGDGIPTWWEYAYGLNPAVSNTSTDTDGDGIIDSVEFSAGFNPLSGNNMGTGQPSDFAASLDIPTLDSDSDGVPNSLDAVPWEKHLHFYRVPEKSYVRIPLGDGLVQGINNRGEVVIVQTQPEGSPKKYKIFVWKNGIRREMLMPALPNGGEELGSLPISVDFDHKGRLLVEHDYFDPGQGQAGMIRNELVLFEDVSVAVPMGVKLDVAGARPLDQTGTGDADSVRLDYADNITVPIPCLMNNGRIFRISATWENGYSAGLTMEKTASGLYKSEQSTAFPWLYEIGRSGVPTGREINGFVVLNRDGWGIISQTPFPGGISQPVFTKPLLPPLTGFEIITETGFQFGQYPPAIEPRTMAPLRKTECGSWPVMTEEEDFGAEEGTIGWTYEEVANSPSTPSGWERFHFRSRPTAQNPTGTPQHLNFGYWNARGEFLAKDKDWRYVLWRNGTRCPLLMFWAPQTFPTRRFTRTTTSGQLASMISEPSPSPSRKRTVPPRLMVRRRSSSPWS